MNHRAALALPALLAGAAQASIVSTTGACLFIGAPVSLDTNALASPDLAYAIDERQNVFYSGPADQAIPNFLPAMDSQNATNASYTGRVNSHIVHADATPYLNGHNNVSTITFAEPIVALIYRSATLDATDDLLGNPGTLYPHAVPNRGFNANFDGLDTVVLLDDHTIQLTLGAALDEIRVLTAAVPTPAPLALIALSGLGVARRRR